VRATRINHVSVKADDLDESARFYEELFGMVRVPAPNFPEVSVVWLELGDQQLHLFHPGGEPLAGQHFGLDVEDFEAVYRKAKERGLLVVNQEGGRSIRMHPAGWAQMYVRDPSGNLVEIDCPDVETLPPDIRSEIPNLDDDLPQVGTERTASLYKAVEAGGA